MALGQPGGGGSLYPLSIFSTVCMANTNIKLKAKTSSYTIAIVTANNSFSNLKIIATLSVKTE